MTLIIGNNFYTTAALHGNARISRSQVNTNYCAIFGRFISSGDGGWTEKNKSKEEEERER
jgi:hypothetical protein